jgi:hypothetical protein
MKRNFDPKKYGDYEAGEIALLVKLSAMLKPAEDIIEKFRKATGKNLSLTTLQEIQADFSARIAMEAELYLKHVEGSPFFHPRLVADMAYELWMDCREEKARNNVRLGKDEWDVNMEADNKTALSVLKFITDYFISLEKLKIEKEKRALPGPLMSDNKVEEEIEETTWRIE